MAKTVTVRNIPDRVIRKLRNHARSEGRSLASYLRFELKKLASKPTMAQMVRRINSKPPVELPISAAEMVRELRGR